MGRFDPFQHARCADEDVCLFDRSASFFCKRSFRPHADAYHSDSLAPGRQSELVFEGTDRLLQRQTFFFFRRPADDDSLYAAFLRCRDFFFIAPGAACILRHHPGGLRLMQHGDVHLFAEGTADRQDPVCRKSAFVADADGIRKGKQSCVDPGLQG